MAAAARLTSTSSDARHPARHGTIASMAAPSRPLGAALETRRPRALDAALWAIALVLVAAGGIQLAALLDELAGPMSSGIHHDFLAFYAAGKLVLEGRPSELYDAGALTAIQRSVIPFPVGANGYMPFINPPFAAVAFAPIAALPAQLARVAWAALSLAMLVLAGLWMARPLPVLQRVATTLLVALSFPAYHSLAEGQWSAAMLLAGVAALWAARRGSWGLAGLFLAAWWLKPQLVLLPLVALALDRRWTAVGWTVLGGVALVVASLPFVGVGIYLQYAGYLVAVGLSHFNGAGAVARSVWQGDLATTEGLNGLFVGYLGQAQVTLVDVLWGVLSIALVLLWLVAAWFERPRFDSLPGRRMIAAGIGIVLLVNPNLFIQDTVLVFLLLPALWPLPAGTYWRETIGMAILAAVVLLDQPLGTHLFTLALLAIVVALCASAIASSPRGVASRIRT